MKTQELLKRAGIVAAVSLILAPCTLPPAFGAGKSAALKPVLKAIDPTQAKLVPEVPQVDPSANTAPAEQPPASSNQLPYPPSGQPANLEQYIPEFGKPNPQLPPSMNQPAGGPGWSAGTVPGRPSIPPADLSAPAQGTPDDPRVGRLEQIAFGSAYPEHDTDDRIEHLEREVFGQVFQGDAESRLRRLEGKLGGAGAFNSAGGPQQTAYAPPPPVQQPYAPPQQNQPQQPYIPPYVPNRPPQQQYQAPAQQPYQGAPQQQYQAPPSIPQQPAYVPPPQQPAYPHQIPQQPAYQPPVYQQQYPYPAQQYGQQQPYPQQQPSYARQQQQYPAQQFQPPQQMPPQQMAPQYPTQQFQQQADQTAMAPPSIPQGPVTMSSFNRPPVQPPPVQTAPQQPMQQQPMQQVPAQETPKAASNSPVLAEYDKKAGDYSSVIPRMNGAAARWTSFPIRIHLPMNTPENWRAPIEAAIKKWGQYIPTSVAPTSEPADVEVGWINHLAPRQLGITNLEIFNGHPRVTVYLLRPTYYPPEVPETLLQKVALHEIGHAVGIFGHSPNPNDMMFPVESATAKASVKASGISPRDVNTLRRIYDSPPLPDGFQSPQPISWP